MLRNGFYYVKIPVHWDCSLSEYFPFPHSLKCPCCGYLFLAIYDILFHIFTYLLKGEHTVLPPHVVPYRKLSWYWVGRHWLMCEGLPAFLSTSIPILCTQRTDSNLCSCHGDALLPLSMLQGPETTPHFKHDQRQCVSKREQQWEVIKFK